MLRFVSRLFTRSKPLTYRSLSTKTKPEEPTSNRELFFDILNLGNAFAVLYLFLDGSRRNKEIAGRGVFKKQQQKDTINYE